MHSRFVLIATLAGAGVAPCTAFAQAPADTAPSLPAIVVTATRAPSSPLATPLAVTKVGAGQLRAVRGVGLDEAMSLVPGVLAQSRYGSSDVRLVIRGFGARGAGDRSNAGTSRGVRVLVDGLPETEPDGRTSFDQIDLATSEGVEVVRSNASAVWGNAAGGVVNVLSVPSHADGSGLEAGVMTGTFGLRRYTSRAVSTFGDGGVAFANLTNTSFDGWRAHSSARRALVNAGVVGTLGTATRVGVYLSGTNNLFHIPGPLTQAELDTNPRQANVAYAARDERRYNRVARLATTLDRTVGDASSISAMIFVNPKVLQRSERGTFRDFTRYHLGGNLIGRAEHGREGTVRGRVTAGVDEAYQDGAILFYSLTPQATRGATLRDNKREGANNFGAFAQDELCVGDRACLTVGARYDAVNYHYQSYITPSLNDSKSFTRVSPKVGLSYLLDSSHSVYANVGGGIEVPAGNETDPAGTFGQDTVYAINPLLDAIRSTTYEIGAKSVAAPASGALVSWGYDLALYTTDVRNEIVPYQGGRFYFTAGRARRSGAELGITASLRDGPFARGALTLSRNRYTTYIVDSTYYGTPGARADYSGNEIVGVPSMIANAEIGTAIPGMPSLRIKGGVEHTGTYFVDDANSTRVKPYTMMSATLEFGEWSAGRGVGLGLRGFVSVENVFDTRYVGSAFLNPDRVGGVPVAYEPGMPRAVVVSLSAGRLR